MRLANQFGYNIKDQTFFSQFQNKGYPGHKKNSVASWNTQGNLLATAQNSLKIWSFDSFTGLQVVSQVRSNDSINQVKFYHQTMLATISKQIIKFWDTRQSIKPIRTQKKNKPDILAFSWNHDTSVPYFTLLMKDNSINIYDLRNFINLNQPLYTDKTDKNKNDISAIQWDYSGSVLFCVGGDSSSSLLAMYTNTLQPISQITSPHNSKINSIAIDPSNQYLATCSDDSNVAISTIPDIVCERIYSHTDCVMSKVAFSSKSQYLAVYCDQPKLQIASNKGQQVKVTVQEPCIDFYNVKAGGHAHRIRCGIVQQVLQWHPKKTVLAYFDFDNQDRKRPGSQRQERYLHIFGI